MYSQTRQRSQPRSTDQAEIAAEIAAVKAELDRQSAQAKRVNAFVDRMMGV
jgi:hypothetical protein